MAKKRRHHYVPRFYLEGFVDPHNSPYIWIYEKGNPVIKKSTPKDIAVKKHYYSFITPEGKKDSESFEDLLSMIEAEVAPVFEKLKGQEHLNEEQRWLISMFLSFTMTRVPNFRENIEKALAQVLWKFNQILASDPEAFESMVEDFEKDTGEKIGMPIEEFRKYVLGGEYDIKVNPQFSLGMLAMAEKFVPIFYEMKWAFYEAADDYKFVTSDNPLFFVDPTHDPTSFFGVGLLNRNIEVTFPVTKDLMFFGTWKDFKGYKKSNNRIVKELNRRTVISAQRFVFAPQHSDGLNRFVQKHKGSAPVLEIH